MSGKVVCVTKVSQIIFIYILHSCKDELSNGHTNNRHCTFYKAHLDVYELEIKKSFTLKLEHNK